MPRRAPRGFCANECERQSEEAVKTGKPRTKGLGERRGFDWKRTFMSSDRLVEGRIYYHGS